LPELEPATLWYHPHTMGLTGEQVYQGLAGLFLIEDEVSDNLDIPKTYGVDDIPIIVQDRRFFGNGQFAYVQNMRDVMTGVIGNYLLVNGKQGRKDTVLIMSGETVLIISRFRNYTGVYMYHCHLLEHEDDGMMGQFEVIT